MRHDCLQQQRDRPDIVDVAGDAGVRAWQILIVPALLLTAISAMDLTALVVLP